MNNLNMPSLIFLFETWCDWDLQNIFICYSDHEVSSKVFSKVIKDLGKHSWKLQLIVQF